MRRAVTSARVLRLALLTATVTAVAYLFVLALRPSISAGLPAWFRWFGRSGSWQTISLVVALLAVLCVLRFRAHSSNGSGNVPISVIAGLAATSAVLGLGAYWNCHDATHPPVITPLTWTAALVKGSVSDLQLSGHICPDPPPPALEVARLAALGAIFTGLGGVVIAVFKSQLDRIRVSLAGRVTAVIGIDTDTRSMVGAIARTLERRSTLVVITDGLDDAGEQEARRQGARLLTVNLDTAVALEALSVWPRLERLYLMSADPSTNLYWLEVITRRLAEVGNKQRLPLIVRIDDPWQAEAWRARQFGGTGTRWAADALGKYEVTARYLLDYVTADSTIQRVFVCGTSQLTLALCADLTRRQLERDYYTAPGETALPALILVGEDAEEYRQDHEFYRRQLGLVSSGPTIEAKGHAPTVRTLTRLIGASGAEHCAAIFVDDPTGRSPDGATMGTRLAARLPAMAVYVWDPDARRAADRYQIVGQLRTYRLAVDVAEGQTQDAWERAARLIHERYRASMGADPHDSPARKPWAELGEFYRGSNRRQVRNALWMVERIAGHTWNTWGTPPVPLADRDMVGLPPLEQLARLGFDRETVMKMAQAEHDSWCRYYRRGGWRQGAARDDGHRVHDKLVDWSAIETNPDLLNAALTSLAATLWSLRQLGYRSQPVWQRFTRVGTVTAEQRHSPWTWTSQSGETMQADAGDWAVQQDGECWSVRNTIFQATYEHVADHEWRRRGRVLARLAQPGEVLETLEGLVTAAEGDWVVRGADGEQWPVPAAEFARRYVEVRSTPAVADSAE